MYYADSDQESIDKENTVTIKEEVLFLSNLILYIK